MKTKHHVEHIPVTVDADGSEIALTVHRITGGEGPTLSLFGPQHGDEWWTLTVLRKVIADLTAQTLTGTVLVVPVCNPPALRDGTRITQADADEPDMNRAWGGQNTWIANLLCQALDDHVVSKSDALMDFHLGPTGSAFGAVCFGNDYPDESVSRRSRELTLAFGYPVVGEMAVCGRFPARSLAGWAGTTHQLPTVLVEIGGAGHGAELEQEWSDECRSGVINVAHAMGIVAARGTVAEPSETLLYRGATRVNPRVGGLLIPADGFALGQQVSTGQVLGEVLHPQTFELLETLTSPGDGILMYFAASRMVRPGDWAFGLIDTATSEVLRHG